jgi:hypothetical protein
LDRSFQYAGAGRRENLPVPYRVPGSVSPAERYGAMTVIRPLDIHAHRYADRASASSAYAEGERRDRMRLPAGFFRSRIV